MSRHNTIRATLAITAAAFAIGAGSAGAMPIDGPHGAAVKAHSGEYDAGHASLAMEQAQTQASAQDVLASEGIVTHADLRGEQAKAAADLAQRPDTAGNPVVPSAPTFSTANVTPLHSTQLAQDDGNGTEVSLLAIIAGLAGAGLVGVGAAFAVSKTTRSRRPRAIA